MTQHILAIPLVENDKTQSGNLNPQFAGVHLVQCCNLYTDENAIDVKPVKVIPSTDVVCKPLADWRLKLTRLTQTSFEAIVYIVQQQYYSTITHVFDKQLNRWRKGLTAHLWFSDKSLVQLCVGFFGLSVYPLAQFTRTTDLNASVIFFLLLKMLWHYWKVTVHQHHLSVYHFG